MEQSDFELMYLKDSYIEKLSPILSWFLFQKLMPKSIFCYHRSHGFSPVATFVTPFQGL